MNYETGLEVLDLLLNVLLADLPHVEIRVEGKCYKETVLDDVESCIIFSNLLQNARSVLEKKDGRLSLKVEGGEFIAEVTV